MSKRILVVADQKDLREVLRTLLAGSGYAVIEADNVEAGELFGEADTAEDLPGIPGKDAVLTGAGRLAAPKSMPASGLSARSPRRSRA
jgi:CheY-like chemotaxis protein